MKRIGISFLLLLLLFSPVLASGSQREISQGNAQVAPSDVWWDGATCGWIFGLAGSIMGLAGAMIGVLCGIGRGRRLVLALHGIFAGLGAIALAAGFVALWIGQPYGVWYPLVLGGGIGVAVFGGLLPVSRRSYIQRELRKMQAMDV